MASSNSDANNDKPMVIQSSNNGASSDKYYPSSKKDELGPDILSSVLTLGGFIAIGYILNNYFIDKNNMGEGRILNNRIYNYAQGIQDLSDTPNFTRGELADKRDYIQRMYRTHNTVYPDILYEGVRRQPAIDNAYVNYPMPASDDTLLTYAEPSNIVTDDILYEQVRPILEKIIV